MSVFAAEVTKIEARCRQLLVEAFPRTTTEMLSEWESVCGVSGAGLTTDQRRAQLIAKLAANGNQTIAFFYGIAGSLGYNKHPSTTDPHIRIATGEFTPFRAGISGAGSPVYDQTSGASLFTVRIFGTNIESDAVLRGLFDYAKPAEAEFVYVNE